jgi:hypothetical protein
MDVFRLFEDFQRLSGMVLAPGIVDMIYNVTSGHQGMVCFCGKVIQEKLLLEKTFLSLKEWIDYEMFRLPQ